MSVLMILAMFIAIIFLRKSISKISSHIEDEITTEIAESRKDLYQRAQDAYDDLVETCGEDFKTPEEIYRMMNKQHRKSRNNNK